MICEFCGHEGAADHPVDTKLGRAAVLCGPCQTRHGIRPSRKPKRSFSAKKKGRRQGRPGQMFFPFYQMETGSPPVAARS